jgi:hypothetical protein
MPPGLAKITVQTPPANQSKGGPPPDAKAAGMVQASADVVPVPEKYRQASTSGLTYEVKAGSQTHDVEMK